ncbi:MAG: hypothetical protein ACI4NM_08315 [Bullifex sp.]
MASELGELDDSEMIIIYLFLLFLTSGDDAIDMADGLSYEEMTELAYRARWMEKEAHMEGDEIFRFLCSIRDREFSTIKESIKRGFEDNVNPFFIREGKKLTAKEISETVASCWSSRRVTKFNEWQVAMAENMLSVTDGDRILIETEYMPGPFMSIGSDFDRDLIIAVSDSEQRVLTKMAFFMCVPEAERSRCTITCGYESNEKRSRLVFSKNLVLFPDFAFTVRNEAVFQEVMDKDVTKLFVVNDSFLRMRNRGLFENRRHMVEVGSNVYVLSFGIRNPLAPSMVLMSPKTADSSVSMLSVRFCDEILNDESCSQIATALKGSGENCFSPSVMKVSREEACAHDYMLIPDYYRESGSSEIRNIYEIDKELDREYEKMRGLTFFFLRG